MGGGESWASLLQSQLPGEDSGDSGWGEFRMSFTAIHRTIDMQEDSTYRGRGAPLQTPTRREITFWEVGYTKWGIRMLQTWTGRVYASFSAFLLHRMIGMCSVRVLPRPSAP